MRETQSQREQVSVFALTMLVLFDVIAKVTMAGAAKNEHPLAGWSALEQLVHPGQRGGSVALGSEEERGDFALPGEGEGHGKDAGERLGVARGGQRHDGAEAIVHLRRRQHGPTAKAAANQTDALRVDLVRDFARSAGEQFV